MDSRQLSDREAATAQDATAAVARMVFHPRDILRLDDLNVPENMELHRPLALISRDDTVDCKAHPEMCEKPPGSNSWILPTAVGLG